jgi:uncharacterized protein YdhG (YjbR/CyaY superfamily)
MARTDFKSIDEYIASRPAKVQAVLRRVRRVIRKAMPGAEEVISYQMPAYRVDGRIALYFAGWAEHYSLYPATGGLAEALGDEVAPYVVSKGTIRFPLDEPMPTRLIARIARFRANEAAGRARKLVFARARKAVRAIRLRASDTGRDALTRPEIEREVQATRRALRQRTGRG